MPYPQRKKMKVMLPVITGEHWGDKLVTMPSQPKANEGEYGMSHVKKSYRKKKPEEESTLSMPMSLSENEMLMSKFASSENEDATKKRTDLSLVEAIDNREQDLEEKKILMASKATAILEDPSKVSNLRYLINMLTELHNDKSSITSMKYLMVTLLKVFSDLIPCYRVQENLFDKKVSKEMLNVGMMELNFLNCYRSYLQTLEKISLNANKCPDDKAAEKGCEMALYSLGKLIVTNPLFNYSLNIVQFLVPFLNSNVEKYRSLAAEPLSQVIRESQSSHLTLHIVKRIYKLVQKSRFNIKEDVIKVLFALQFKEFSSSKKESADVGREEEQRTRKFNKLVTKAALEPSRKKKKSLKKVAKLRERMAESNVRSAMEGHNTVNSEVVQLVFGIYFHILKKKVKSHLMPIVLEGLSKFAHLINVELFVDLLAVLNDLIKTGDLGVRERLFCIETVFTLLAEQGEAVNVDPECFYRSFYITLASISTDHSGDLATALRIFQLIFLSRRRDISNAKILAFAKRLSTLLLSFPLSSTVPALALIKRTLTKFAVTKSLLDSDSEGALTFYAPESDDPELSHSSSTALWDMTLLQNHHHEAVRCLSKNILTGNSSRNDADVHNIITKPIKTLAEYVDPSCSEFNPEMPLPSKHLVSKKTSFKAFEADCWDLQNENLQKLCESCTEEASATWLSSGDLLNSQVSDLDFYQDFHLTST